MARDGIVVTGTGAYAAGARSPRELFDVVLAGRSPADWVPMDGIDAVAASRAPDPELVGDDLRLARRLDRTAQLGLMAAYGAMRQSGLEGAVDPRRVGVMIGTGRGPIGRTLQTVRELANGNIGPSTSAESTPGSLNGIISQAFGLGGPSATVIATCASGATAIAFGALHLLAGEAEAMVVGGAEAPLVPLMAMQLKAARVTGWHEDPRLTCRPFDLTRNGLMMGEGAGFLVLETERAAERRNAPILARLTGWGCGIDAGGRTGVTADGEGLVRVVESALARAGLAPQSIDYVNAHGTGTRLNDSVEARALNTVFGESAVPPISSTKPITGHCLGATAAIEAVIAIEALRSGSLPPTANHVQRDSDCHLDVISGAPRHVSARAVLSTSLGFWGSQAALIFESA